LPRQGGGKGRGLGLSMVYGFVNQSRGHLRTYSEPGEGTTIRLYFPRSYAAVVADVEDVAIVTGGSEHILVVEDDDEVRRHTIAQLEALGYRTTSASSGSEALALVEQTPDIDLVFTDVIMPGGMNGRELAEQVGRVRPQLRVLFTSGYT